MTRLQLPLALNPPRRPSFDNFVAGPNRVVVATLNGGVAVGEWCFLAGPPGSGRSHLLAAFFAERCRQGEQAHFVALKKPRQHLLLEHATGHWVVLDDIDQLAGDPEGEQALFNALNRWRAERTGVLMSGAGRAAFALPDLRSRLGQATRLTLKPLEEPELGELVRKLAAEHEVVLGRGVVEYSLSRAPRNPGCLAELIQTGAQRALVERRTLSVPLVRDLLNEGVAQRRSNAL